MKQFIFIISFIYALFASGQTYLIADAEFKRCLQTTFTGMLSPQGELMLSEAIKPDSFDCSSYGISNIDGLQFFTNLRIIDLHDNKLTQVNELIALPLLQELYIQENELSQLPDLSTASELTVLRADRNFLSSMPELPLNSNLKRLDLNQNNLSSLSSFENQQVLEFINLSRNTNIREIPSLEGLSNLKELHCYLCGLSTFPAVNELANLEFLNIGYNHFKTLPELSSNLKLKTVFANDCMLESFPDVSTLPLFEKYRLYNNHLSFEDFLPLLDIPNYSEVYKIVPQRNFANPLRDNYFEFDSINLQTQLAQTAEGTIYTWYFNGSVLDSSTIDDLLIDSAKFTHSGTYYFSISHPNFPELTLVSDTQTIAVNACINPSGFSYTVEGATCQKAGNLKLTTINQPRTDLSYVLESQSTQRTFTNTTGDFQQLSNPNYKLYVYAGNRCVKLIDNNVLIPIEKCKEAFFTPNNDGIDDNFYFEQAGEAKIYNKWGQLIQTLTIPAEWDGKLMNSEKITPGYYTVDINDGQELIRISVVY